MKYTEIVHFFRRFFSFHTSQNRHFSWSFILHDDLNEIPEIVKHCSLTTYPLAFWNSYEIVKSHYLHKLNLKGKLSMRAISEYERICCLTRTISRNRRVARNRRVSNSKLEFVAFFSKLQVFPRVFCMRNWEIGRGKLVLARVFCSKCRVDASFPRLLCVN